jgi:tetratricopeptide (TPR) repeat protein
MKMLGAARGRQGQVAMIEGAAGIGKTRLAEEVAARAQRRGARVGVGRCWPEGDAPPLWPWRAILRELDAPQGLLDEPAAASAGGRFGRFLAVLDHIRASPPAAPLVVVLDDAHLADPATLLLARFLARERRGLPLLMLLTRRDEPQGVAAEVLELLVDLERDATPIRLSPLSAAAMAAFLAAAGIPPPDPDLLSVVASVTKGNPLHLRSLTLRTELTGAGLQDSLEHAVARLLQRLSEADRGLVGIAALLGPRSSVHEVARVAGVPPSVVATALAGAVRLGLAFRPTEGRFSFMHELARDVALASLPADVRVDAHARAAAVLSGHEPEVQLRRARHALAVAHRSREDAATAVTTAREAARALLGVDGFELAAALLERAVEIHEAAALTGPAAQLTVERAEAVLACGRLAEARPLFLRAARTAEAEAEPEALARAALGSGGVWLAEHRLAPEAERVLALQRRALEALPAGAAVLRARLAVRLAAEAAFRNGLLEPVIEAVEAVRGTHDPRALAEALSLCHHALAGPEHTWRRLQLADELIGAAAEGRDGLLALVGSCWRTADLFLLADPRADAALAELRRRSDALQCRSVLFAARAMGVMRTIRQGDLAGAEREAAECFELGSEVGDADAAAYSGAHLCAIRYFQGREAELAETAAQAAASPTLVAERERAFGAAAALFALRGGRPGPAEAMLERLRGQGLGSIPPSSSWLVAMLATVEVASLRHDRSIAGAAYRALLPYAGLPIMGSLLAVVCFGSSHRALGVAALALGHLDAAIEHFTEAVAANEKIGHVLAGIQARAELGLALLRRAHGEDRARGRALLQQAIAAGEAAAMDGLVARWRQEAAGGESGRHVARQAVRMSQPQTGRWRVVHGDNVATVPDRVGMRYLARLVAAPDQSIPAVALVLGAAPGCRRPQPLLDERALGALRERIQELRCKRGRSPQDEEDIATLARELARATGLGGRVRSFTDVPERARVAVRKAIKRAIDEISLANPSVGRHLTSRVETGSACRYRLDSAAPGDVN